MALTSRVPGLALTILLFGSPSLHAQVDSLTAKDSAPHCEPTSPGGELSGRVFRERDGTAIASAVVHILGTGCQVISRDDGSFRIAHLPASTYVLLVRAIGFSWSDSVTATVAEGVVATVSVPLSRVGGSGSPLPLDSARVVSCANQAYRVGSPPSRSDSLLIVALCVAMGNRPGYCVEWDGPQAQLLSRFQWHPGRPVRASACTVESEVTDKEWRWELRHPAGHTGVFLRADILQDDDSTVTVEAGYLSHPLGGFGMKCQVTRAAGGWVPHRWCYRTWES